MLPSPNSKLLWLLAGDGGTYTTAPALTLSIAHLSLPLLTLQTKHARLRGYHQQQQQCTLVLLISQSVQCQLMMFKPRGDTH